MTTPTPDQSGAMAAGYYYAQGDPVGTVRYWDGSQWVGDPMPAPPSASGAAPATDSGGADVGWRILAVLIDGVIGVVLSIVAAIPFIEDTSDQTGDDFSFEVTGPGVFIGWGIFLLIMVVMVSKLGGSPGKLATGMRITTLDGERPSMSTSVLRVVPWILTLIPLLGIVIWLGIAIAGVIMIATDPQNRSPFDRIASTRVIRR